MPWIMPGVLDVEQAVRLENRAGDAGIGGDARRLQYVGMLGLGGMNDQFARLSIGQKNRASLGAHDQLGAFQDVGDQSRQVHRVSKTTRGVQQRLITFDLVLG